jgi:pyruvate dehydrogenase (quinone)
MATTAAEVMVSTLKAAGVRREMKAAGIPTYGIDLVDPDFVGIARSAGLFGVRVEKASELDDALRGVHSRRPRPSRRPHRPAGTLAAAQAHLRADQGLHPVRDQDHPVRRGSELVELTKTNLRQVDVE